MKKDPDKTLRDEIARRLRALQAVAGATEEQMAQYLGITRQAWSNATRKPDPKTNKPSPEAMVRLCERTKLTMEWIYRGDYDNVPHLLAEALKAELEPDPEAPPAQGDRVRLPGLVVKG